jgi:tetratricopeptide (TPR) repeat protein
MQNPKRSLPRLLAVLWATAIAFGCSAEAKKSRLLQSAERYFGSGDYDKAKIEYLNVLRSDPQNAVAIQRLGTIWYEQGAPSRAAPFLLKTRELLPDDIESRTRLAQALMSVRHFEEARKEALAILEQSPAHDEAMLVLVEASRSPEERRQNNGYVASTRAMTPVFIWHGPDFVFGSRISLPPQAQLSKRFLSIHARSRLIWPWRSFTGGQTICPVRTRSSRLRQNSRRQGL